MGHRDDEPAGEAPDAGLEAIVPDGCAKVIGFARLG